MANTHSAATRPRLKIERETMASFLQFRSIDGEHWPLRSEQNRTTQRTPIHRKSKQQKQFEKMVKKENEGSDTLEIGMVDALGDRWCDCLYFNVLVICSNGAEPHPFNHNTLRHWKKQRYILHGAKSRQSTVQTASNENTSTF